MSNSKENEDSEKEDSDLYDSQIVNNEETPQSNDQILSNSQPEDSLDITDSHNNETQTEDTLNPHISQTQNQNISAQDTKNDSHDDKDQKNGNQSNNEIEKRRKRKKKFKLFSNIINHFFFIWIFQLMKQENIQSFILVLENSLTANWNSKIEYKKSIQNTLFLEYFRKYSILAFYKLFWILFIWIGNFYFLDYLLENGTKTHGGLHFYAAGLGLCCILGSMCFHHLTIASSRIGIQCRAALMVMVYRKSLKLSYIKGGVGEIVNLISVECNRIAEAFVNFHYIWSAIMECIILLIFSHQKIGIAALVPVGLVIFVVFPLQFFLSVTASRTSIELTTLITKRVHLMSEILTAIKLIKIYAWEKYYHQKLSSLRQKEMELMLKELQLRIATFIVIFATPALCVVLGILSYQKRTELTPDQVFELLFLFNTLRYTLYVLPSSERNINGAKIAMEKLQEFMQLPEIGDQITIFEDLGEGVVMKIEDANFEWDGDLDHPHLSNLSLTLKRNELIAVVGDIGSGKSLLAAIMGQIRRTAGTVSSICQSFGFVPQEPWFINASLRDNIIFGLEYDEKKYGNAIRVSGLKKDLLMLSNGDQSYITELNLSPSQKQRVSLARCIYQNPSIILLEDFFGDFDTTHARQLFKGTIKSELCKGRSVVMLTSQKQFLGECDRILVMKGGHVVDSGTEQELKSRHVNFSGWVTDVTHMDDDPNNIIDTMSEIRLNPETSITKNTSTNPLKPPLVNLASSRFSKKAKSPLSDPNGTILAESDVTINNLAKGSSNTRLQQIKELNANSMQTDKVNEHTISKIIERNQGSVLTGMIRPPTNFANQDILARTIEANTLTAHSLHDFDVGTLEATSFVSQTNPYILFLKEKPGMFFGIFFLVTTSVSHVFRLLCDLFLKVLVDKPRNLEDHNQQLAMVGIFVAAIALSITLRGFVFQKIMLIKGGAWHDKILTAVLNAPMSFYEVTPLGHILSFFSRHLYNIDELLPDALLQVLSFIPLVVGTIAITCIFVPWLWTILPILILAYFLVYRTCSKAQDQFGQMEAANKSPMFAHLSNTLEGLFLIRLYKAEEKFEHFNKSLIDADHKALYSLLLMKALKGVLLDIISSFFIYIAALFCVLFDVSASNTGLALTNALQLLLFVPWLVGMGHVVDSSISSVASLSYFGANVPKENSNEQALLLDNSWPVDGEIEFNGVTSKYQRYGVSVLKDVSFKIEAGEKIAIVGRSGSGKTTIMISLLRLIEPSSGTITIDGLDITKVSLEDLRSRIAVIPQEPIMLTGTIRTNLDPYNSSTDEEIWEALKLVHLADIIREMPDRLDTKIVEHGRMFNVSERQLFSIARANLIKSSILIYDEPAVTVDRDAEQLINQVMNESFGNTTVIFLATRFRAIVQMDKIMVMSKGQVVEFDTPLNLLNDPKSKFSLMASQTGDVDIGYLKMLALRKGRNSSRSNIGELFNSPLSLSMNRLPSMPHSLRSLYAQKTQSSHSLPSLSGEINIQPIPGSSIYRISNESQDSSNRESAPLLKVNTNQGSKPEEKQIDDLPVIVEVSKPNE